MKIIHKKFAQIEEKGTDGRTPLRVVIDRLISVMVLTQVAVTVAAVELSSSVLKEALKHDPVACIKFFSACCLPPFLICVGMMFYVRRNYIEYLKEKAPKN